MTTATIERADPVRVLLVEDEARLADSIARGLRQTAHAVDVADRLSAARQKLEVERYDAVILDVNMPDGSGFGLAAELRKRAVPIPILMLTARDGVEDRVTGLDSGADDYLVKPFAFDELLARLRALQRRAPESRPIAFSVADLTLDPATRTVSRAGRPVELTTTEYALLDYLARHAGVVCGRAAISGAVWDENYDPFSNIIDVYVSRLRRKVDQPGLVPLIHTVRGAGYTLDPARSHRPV
ncbi:MAG TPA: response regulator transcription factor [Gemmatimonadales bacterium]|jgi:DNA-binding response OmpR family regulator|nr:response regulator transcription factor [Gemmatimonadales bacterium]